MWFSETVEYFKIEVITVPMVAKAFARWNWYHLNGSSLNSETFTDVSQDSKLSKNFKQKTIRSLNSEIGFFKSLVRQYLALIKQRPKKLPESHQTHIPMKFLQSDFLCLDRRPFWNRWNSTAPSSTLPRTVWCLLRTEFPGISLELGKQFRHNFFFF